MMKNVEPFITMAYSANPNFVILNFECTTLNCLLLGTVSRSDELIRIDIENFENLLEKP